jgi:hypothetical protein
MEAPADLRDLRNMTDRDRAANAAALFLAAQEPGPGGREYQPPAVEVGGVLVAVYVRDGALVVTVDPAGADPEVFRLHGETAAVPMAVSIAEGRVFEICPGDDPPPGRHRKQGDEPYS